MGGLRHAIRPLDGLCDCCVSCPSLEVQKYVLCCAKPRYAWRAAIASRSTMRSAVHVSTNSKVLGIEIITLFQTMWSDTVRGCVSDQTNVGASFKGMQVTITHCTH